MTFDEFCWQMVKRGYLEVRDEHFVFTHMGEVYAAQLLQLEGEYMQEMLVCLRAVLAGTGG